MHDQTKASIIAAALFAGLLAIVLWASAHGQKEVPDDRPSPSRTVSVRR